MKCHYPMSQRIFVCLFNFTFRFIHNLFNEIYFDQEITMDWYNLEVLITNSIGSYYLIYLIEKESLQRRSVDKTNKEFQISIKSIQIYGKLILFGELCSNAMHVCSQQSIAKECMAASVRFVGRNFRLIGNCVEHLDQTKSLKGKIRWNLMWLIRITVVSNWSASSWLNH